MEFGRVLTYFLQQRGFCQAVCVLALSGMLCAQTPPPLAPPGTIPAPNVPGAPSNQAPQDLTGQVAQLRSNYILRNGDQILIHATDADEISTRPWLISEDGFVDLPLVGKIKAAGVSLQDFEATLTDALKKYIVTPQVSVSVTQFANEPVFFVGAFHAPGLYPLVGKRNLVEMVASVGGLQPGASNRIKLTRKKDYGAIPLPKAIALPDGGSSVVINMTTLQNSVNPEEDILLQPYDVISVDTAEMIYFVGAGLGRAGSVPVGPKDSMPVLQVLVQAGGVSPQARLTDAVILRPVMDTSRVVAIPVNLKSVMLGKEKDRPLLPNDVLVVGATSLANLTTLVPLITIPLSVIAILARFL